MARRTLLNQTHKISRTFTDKELVHMLRSTESRLQDQALSYLIRSTGDIYPMIKRLICQHNGSMDDFSEVLQEGLIALNRMIKRPNFELKAQLKTIIYRICYNIWMRELRRRSKYTEIEEVTEESMGFTVMGEMQISSLDRIPDVVCCLIERLPQKLAQAIAMRYIEELPYAEMQTKLNHKSYSVTRNAVSRGISGLKKMVDREPNLRKLLMGLRQSA